MKIWIWLVVAFAALAASRDDRPTAPAVATTSDGDTTLADVATGELEQAESTFAYDIVERATDRTNDDLRALDVNVNGLLAVQAAIYAILIDKLDEFSIVSARRSFSRSRSGATTSTSGAVKTCPTRKPSGTTSSKMPLARASA